MKFSQFLNEAPLLSPLITRDEIIKSVPTYKEFMRNKNKLEKVGYYKDYNFIINLVIHLVEENMLL